MYDGNRVIASHIARPWKKQLNLFLAYLYFYNPIWFVVAISRFSRRKKLGHRPALLQIFGMLGLLHTFWRTAGWAVRLAFQKIERFKAPPPLPMPMHDVNGGPAAHDPSARISESAKLYQVGVPVEVTSG